MIVISGYTINTKYEEEIKDLESGLKKYKIPYKFYPYKDRGTWVRNTMEKAVIVQQALREFPQEDIIWLDADASIFKKPQLFFELDKYNFHIGCYYHRKELLSGTFIFRNTRITRELVDDWVNDDEINWDQRKLQKFIEWKYKWVLHKMILKLPTEYIKINPKGEDFKNLDCVIGHKQLSRITAPSVSDRRLR